LLISFAVGNVTVTGVGAIPRVELLHRRSGLSRAFIVGTWLLENVFDLTILLLWAVLVPFAITLPQSEGLGQFLRIHLFLVLPLMLMIIMLVALWRQQSIAIALLKRLGVWEKTINRLPWQMGKHLDGIGDGLTASLRNIWTCSGAWLTTATIWVLEATMFWLLMLSLKIDLNILEASMVTVYTHLVIGIPSVPGFFGTLELSTASLLLMLGGNSAAALAYVILLRVFFIGPTTLAGIIAAAREGWNMRALVPGTGDTSN
jgi:uncharacterized protein (TIRG00374 family)